MTGRWVTETREGAQGRGKPGWEGGQEELNCTG